jgi:hypothetical protein
MRNSSTGRTGKLLHGTRHVGQHQVGEPVPGKTLSAPEVFDQGAPFRGHVAEGMDGDGAVVDQLDRLGATHEQADGEDHRQTKRPTMSVGHRALDFLATQTRCPLRYSVGGRETHRPSNFPQLLVAPLRALALACSA